MTDALIIKIESGTLDFTDAELAQMPAHVRIRIENEQLRASLSDALTVFNGEES